MTKKQFRPEAWKQKGIRKDHEAGKLARVDRQRREFNGNAQRGFWWMDTSTLSLQQYRKGHVTSFMVMLDEPLPKRLVDTQLEKAFGKNAEEVKTIG